MMTTNVTVEHAEDLKRERVTTVSSGGWCVRISGPNVTVPVQDSAGKPIEDLASLLQTAYRMAGTPINSGIGSLARVRASLSEPLLADLVAVLRAAQRLAASNGTGHHATSIDASHWRGATPAWRCRTPFWSRPLRAGLPPSTTLCDFNSDANVHSVHALFEIAIARLTNSGAAVHVA